MTEEEIKKLEFIKQHIQEGTYRILSTSQWDKFAKELSNCGSKILKGIEETRDEAHKIRIALFSGKKLKAITVKFDEVAKEFDLFFDSGMKWLRSVIDGGEYAEYQILDKKYVEELVEHCRQTMDYLGNIISSKRDEYRFFRLLILSIVTVTIVLISLILDFFQFFGTLVK